MGYERASEDSEQYPQNTLYIGELAVESSHQSQGIGRSLLEEFFELNTELGFHSLTGEINFSVQTNTAEWNKAVVSLYESFGFKPRSNKAYPDRTDLVLGAGLDELQLSS
jgi:ribosomal protein S18 acetylase RimI-like enzyme